MYNGDSSSISYVQKVMENSLFYIPDMQTVGTLSLAQSRIQFPLYYLSACPLYTQLEFTLTCLLSVPFDYYPVPLPLCQPAFPQLKPSLGKLDLLQHLSLSPAHTESQCWETHRLCCSQYMSTLHIKTMLNIIIFIDCFKIFHIIIHVLYSICISFLPTVHLIFIHCTDTMLKIGIHWDTETEHNKVWCF